MYITSMAAASRAAAVANTIGGTHNNFDDIATLICLILGGTILLLTLAASVSLLIIKLLDK